jgi:DnaK suppressor protein
MVVALLTSKEREDIGDLLRKRRAMLDRTVRSELHTNTEGEVQATETSDTDWTTADVEADAALSKLERDANELAALDRALEKFELPDFGECEQCGSPIGYPRLLAHPTARLCLSCQTRLEANQSANPAKWRSTT